MKRIPILLLSLFFFAGISSRAQVVIFNDNMTHERMGEIKVVVVDSLTSDPLPFASVYLVPFKDTTITNFTLTDPHGAATLDEVPFGRYAFRVEMMGYKPFVKDRYFTERKVDIGTVRLQVDEQFLQAATITDVGNPIVIKGDTVEFNASSFRVGVNAMLKDLLMRMPGMEITAAGRVMFNGEPIDRITVGGRTFFFDDQSTALSNLPASIVDKIRVIERDSEETRASGVEDGEKEKVLDVALKKEYDKGWFGNLGVKAGAALGDKDDASPLRSERKMLWGGNALVSAYSEKEQLTLIASGQNIDDSGMFMVAMDEDGNVEQMSQGLSTTAQIGLNANTSRIKGVESTVGVNFKNADTDSGFESDRITFLDDGDLGSSSGKRGKNYANALTAKMELKKESGKVWFHLRPGFMTGRTDYTETGSSRSVLNGKFLNSSDNSSHSISNSNSVYLNSDLSIRDLWDKKGYNLLFTLYGQYGSDAGESEERNILRTVSGSESHSMRYLSDGLSYGAGGNVRFTAPVSDKLTFSALGGLNWSGSDRNRDAFDAAGHNDYYSSLSQNTFIKQQYDLTAQYKFRDNNWITLGGRLFGVLNETFSRGYDLEETVGKGEWNWYVAPTLHLRCSKGKNQFTVFVSGSELRPANSRMQPVLNIADPSRLSLGNIYLKPHSNMLFRAEWNRSTPEKFSTLFVGTDFHVDFSPISNASWYDVAGVLYSIPVNVRKPGLNGSVAVNYMTPLNSTRSLFFSMVSYTRVSSYLSYQSKTILPGLDKESFDYPVFMADFWGDPSGNRFYGGESGFVENRTNVFTPSLSMDLKFNRNRFSLAASAKFTGNIARYSLNPDIDVNTLDSRLGLRGSYSTKHEFELSSDLNYCFYNGYQAGYGQPEWQWNAEVNKSVGPFILSVKLRDILNQTRNFTHTVTANYEEDTYRLVMGRYILFGVKWNFGKMNAAHSARARQAAMGMIF